jgi:LPS export ABC transporter protein LptC
MRLRLLAAAVVALLAMLAIWASGTRNSTGPTTASEDAGKTYDYEAHDVVVRQMDADGKLQYEIEAKQVTQLPRNGRISAQELVMRHDPPGSPAGGEERWTLTADRADLPEMGGAITLEGDVQAAGRPQGSRSPLMLQTDKLTYDLESQTISTDSATEVTSGGDRLHTPKGLRANIKSSVLEIESEFHGTFVP